MLVGLLKWTMAVVYSVYVLWVMGKEIIFDNSWLFGFQKIYAWFGLQLLSTVFTVFAIWKFLNVTRRLEAA